MADRAVTSKKASRAQFERVVAQAQSVVEVHRKFAVYLCPRCRRRVKRVKRPKRCCGVPLTYLGIVEETVSEPSKERAKEP